MHRALVKLVALAKREGVALRQSYMRVAKRAAIMAGRYTHAHQFKRARRALKFLRIRLGRVIRDIRSEEHTSEPQSLMRISYAVVCLKKKKTICLPVVNT